MEVIKISNTKIIVVLTKEDMIKYRISPAEMEDFGLPARTALRRILADAENISGFETEHPRVLVQVFSSKEGGCEMFVTGLSAEMSFGDTTHYLHTPVQHVYKFAEFENMLAACRILSSVGWEGDSRAFADKSIVQKRFFLELCKEAPQLCEFGARHISAKKGVQCYLSEHCTLICADAVRILSALA